GNHEASGQVAIGNVTRRTQLRGAFQAGLCTALPAPSLVYPNLVATQPRGRPRGDCAAALAENAQSLMINSMVAGVMGQYLVDLLIHRRLTTFATEIDLGHCTMRSRSITPQQMAQACDTAEHLLIRKETPDEH
ncbi:MAG: hypothetical protein HC828_06005, partial [Blastochloris sp.]|nr:hypothetical protein [Blastochloris sp.]